MSNRKDDRKAKRMIGRFVVADPAICHVQPTFRGTRILVDRQRNPTFFTRDAALFLPIHRHRSYCLVLTSVGQYEVATFVRRFLRHPDFDNQSKRMGRVVRLSHAGVAVLRPRSQMVFHTAWSPPV